MPKHSIGWFQKYSLQRVSLEIQGGEGGSNNITSKESNYELKLEFQGDCRRGEVNQKKQPSVEDVQIFSGTTHVITLTGFWMFFCS